MSRFTTISVREEHMQRAREIAGHFEMNTGGLVGTLIDQEYRRVFGREPEPIDDAIPVLSGKKLRMTGKGGQVIDVLLTDAPELAGMIHKAATKGGAAVKIDGLRPVAVSRKGAGVVIESTDADGQDCKITLAPASALRFATKLYEALTKAQISQ